MAQPTDIPTIERIARRPEAERTSEEARLQQVLDRPLADEDAIAIRQLISSYFGAKATRLMDDLWDERGWTAEHMDKIVTGELEWSDLP